MNMNLILPYAKFFSNPAVKNFLLYSLINIFIRSISAIMIPFTLRLINPSQYGFLALINSFISVGSIFCGIGLRQAFQIEFFHIDTIQRKIMINDIVIVYLIFITPLLFLGLFRSDFINFYFFSSKANSYLVIVIFTSIFLYFFSELYYQVATLTQSSNRVFKVQTIAGIGTIIWNVLFVYCFKLDVLGILIANLMTLLVSVMAALRWYIAAKGYSYINVRHTLNNAKNYVQIGLPFIPSMLFAWIISSSDKWILAKYCSLHDVGIYSLADTFGQLYQMVIMLPLNNAYFPFLLNEFSTKKNLLEVEYMNKKVMFYTLGSLAIIMILGISLLNPLLRFLFPMKYYESLQYILPILFSYLCWTGAYFNLGIIFYRKRIYHHLSALMICCALNLILNCCFIPQFRIYGCVYATLFSYAAYFLITFFFNARELKNIALSA
jgi:O-antigen/teichoic acid export membrane protein